MRQSAQVPVRNRFAFATCFDIINTFICTLSIGTLFTLKIKHGGGGTYMVFFRPEQTAVGGLVSYKG